MTILCAFRDPGLGTWIGSDRLRGGGVRFVMAKHKWVLFDNWWAVGVAGWARAHDVIQHEVDRIARDAMPYEIASGIRKALVNDGFERDTDGQVACYGNTLLLASPMGVWDIDAGFAVSPIPARQMAARGSGADYALGVFHALRLRAEPDVILTTAIDAACTYDPAGCGGAPFVTLLREPA